MVTNGHKWLLSGASALTTVFYSHCMTHQTTHVFSLMDSIQATEWFEASRSVPRQEESGMKP